MSEFISVQPPEEIEPADPIETVQNTEAEIDEATRQMILDKVRDINQDGTAFSVVAKFFGDPQNKYSSATVKKERPGFQLVKNVLNEGLLGTANHHHHFKNEALRQWQWKRNARERKVDKSLIWFSVNGRSLNDQSQFPIENGYMMEDGYGVALSFDLDKFQELPPGAITDWSKFAKKHEEIGGDQIRPELRTYSSSRGHLSTEKIQEFYDNGAQSDEKTDYTGFVAPFRVQPGLFTGLIIGAKVAPTVQEEIIKSMMEVDQDKQNLLLPVYNSRGDLLWPNRMNHDEVVEFIKQKQQIEGRISTSIIDGEHRQSEDLSTDE